MIPETNTTTCRPFTLFSLKLVGLIEVFDTISPFEKDYSNMCQISSRELTKLVVNYARKILTSYGGPSE